MKDSNDEACIKLLIEIKINISNSLYLLNNINQYMYLKNNDLINNQINEIAVRASNTDLINKNNKINMLNNNINHNNNNSNCYTHLSTNFHSIYSNSLIKMNNHSNNNSNIILVNNKSTPVIFNNNNNFSNNNYSNLTYILVDREKDKNSENNTIYNNDNFFCELDIPFEGKNNDLNNDLALDEQLIKIKNLINMKEKSIEKNEKNINMQKNELINLEKKYYMKKSKYENDLKEFNHNIRKLEKDKQKYENQHFDFNDRLLREKFNDYKNQLINDINKYEIDIVNGINNMTLNNVNNDNLLLESKMNKIIYENNNYKIKNNLLTNLDKYVSNIINKKEINNNNNSISNSNSNSSNININNKETISDLSMANKNKKCMKNNNKNTNKRNTAIKNNNNNNSKNENQNKQNNKISFINNSTNSINENNKNIHSEKINNYSSTQKRIINNNILNNNNNKKFKINKNYKYNLNTKKNINNNISCLNKNSIFNSSLSKKIKKILSSNNLLNLQKNNSLEALGCIKSNIISANFYSNTYKAKNKKIKKYPIKLKFMNVADYESFNINRIFPTEPSNNGDIRKSFKQPKEKKNSSINCYNSYNKLNDKYANATMVKDERKKKIFEDKIIQEKHNNNKIKSISADKENNYNNNIAIGNNKKSFIKTQNKNINYDEIKYGTNGKKCASKLKINEISFNNYYHCHKLIFLR